MKIPLYKLLLIQAAYAVALGALCRFGATGIVSGIIVGTALSGIILLVHKKDTQSVVMVGTGSIVGSFVGVSCLGEFLFCRLYGYEHLVLGATAACELAGGVIGAVGGLSFSFFSVLLNKRGKS